MKLETFFEKFELFADAPNAVAKMRELVLRLAVTGKLVAQDERDEPASSLLKSAAAERQQLVTARKIKVRPAAPVEAEEQPYEVPASWTWARLSDVGYELGQKVPDKRFTYIDVGGIDSDKGRISDRVERLEPNEAPSRARKIVARGTVIYSTVRPYLLNIAIVEQDFDAEPIASTAFGILHPFAGIYNRYLYYWLRSAPFTAYVQAGMKGMAYPAINDEKFYGGFIALPPVAEQKRIVAKVDELMALCDRLEAQQQEREAKKADLARASLARFAEAPTPANLEFIFHKSYDITPADLRKSILTLAVRGKLVPQDPSDETVERLLSDIEAERRDFAHAHRFRASSAEAVNESSVPFATPSSWAWCRLSCLFNAITDGDHLPPPKSDDGVAFLTIGNVTTGRLDFDGSRFVPDSYYRALADFRRPARGDILYTVVGATYGRPALVDSDRPFCVQRHIAILKPPKRIEVGFLMVLLRSRLVYDQASASTTGTAQPTIPLGSLRNFVVPLPPLAEQRRIVAKVDQLMALMDRLESQLSESKCSSAKLLEAVLAELAA